MSFKQALRNKDFVITAELPLTSASTGDSILRDAEILRDCVDGFLLTDNQYGQPHMSPAAAAGILLQNGFPPVLQISCRNRNRIALMGELLGARATGIDSLVLVRGGVLPEGYQPRPKAVGDTDAKDLIATARLINDDESLAGGHEFLIGTTAIVHAPGPDAKPQELLAKVDAGAQLAISQICLNAEVLRRYTEFLVANKLFRRVSFMVSIAVIPSADVAVWLRDNRRATIIPERVIEEVSAAADPESVAIDSCSRLVTEIAGIPGVAGINFVATGRLDIIQAVLSQSDIPS